MQEIIRAIDEVKGGKGWRGYNPISRGASTKLDVEDKPVLTDLVNLTCVVDRDHSDAVMDGILAAGAPATSVSHGHFVKDSLEQEDGDQSSINVEWSVVQSILSPGLVDAIEDAVMEVASESGAAGLCMYTFPVPKAQTYLGK